MFCASVLTLFPDMFPGALGFSLVGRALAEKRWHLETVSLADCVEKKGKRVDDAAFGGFGQVLRAPVLERALNRTRQAHSRLLYLSPKGTPLSQAYVRELAGESHLVVLCGRYQGVDQRFLDHYAFEETSLGDFLVSGGELACLVLLDAIVRLHILDARHEKRPGEKKPGEKAPERESHTGDGLLEAPLYTRPRVWNATPVPPVLLEGNHAQIETWRQRQAEQLTRDRRPDLWAARNRRCVANLSQKSYKQGGETPGKA